MQKHYIVYKNDKMRLLKGFFSESAIHFSNFQKKNIPKSYPELEIQNSRPYQNTVMGGNFKFQVQDSFSEYIFGGDLEI